MTYHFRSPGPLTRVLALALVLAVVPIPGFAADGSPAPAPAKKPLAASIEKAAATAKLDAPQAAQAAPAAPADKSALASPSFFKTTPGIIVLGVLGAGAGYAAYSLSHDRIHSTTR